MALKSMTGFARIDRKNADLAVRWELRSVNGRNLDLRIRMPSGFEALERDLRVIAGNTLSRGNVQAVLSAEFAAAANPTLVDETRLEAILEVTKRLVAEGRATPPRSDGLLALRGVLDGGDTDRMQDAVSDEALRLASKAFDEAIVALEQARAREGASLAEVVTKCIDRIDVLAHAARDDQSRAPEALKRRIGEQADLLMDRALDDQRLIQELALIAIRADIGEELDRLDSHVVAGRDLLMKAEPVGRRFDFLAQEMNRESNTICSKSNAISLTAIGLDLKVAVDQLREQVQNIE